MSMKSNLLKGIIYVAIGAASYGVLAICVKLGVKEGFSTGEITFSQAFIGFTVLLLMNLITSVTKRNTAAAKPTIKEKRNLILGGMPLGLTSTFYYLSLQYIDVSICIVLLMQSVWIGSLMDLIVNKTKPDKSKIVAIIVVLVGTILATNLLNSEIELNWVGVFWGMLAALSYTFTMSVSNKVATGYTPQVRSMYMMLGSLIVVILIWGYSLSQQFDVSVLWKWGIVLAVFGTILPPLLFTKGFPQTGLGLGSIVASVELPVSVFAAFLILGENVNAIQWVGIVLILVAVVLMNLSVLKKE